MRHKQPSWRQPLWLSAIVLVAWGWDVSLGHGGVTWVGWVAALALVGGISALTVYSARLHPLPDVAPRSPDGTGNPASIPQGQGDAPEVRVAEAEELESLPAIEMSADTLYEVAGYGAIPGPATVDELAAAGLVLVVGRPALGYARVDVIDGEPHLEQVSVRPKSMKHGYGSALLQGACDWARGQGYESITLCTFADVPWNEPWYLKRGFAEVTELTPGLAALREAEHESGLDEVGRRVVMRRFIV